MNHTSENTIFVQIASYRDPELQHTLQDLFNKAKRPENIFVGICHQYDMKDGADKHLFEVPFPRLDQLRIDEVDYRESEGCCWARNRVQKLWQGEKWTLITDAHMRFKESWDEELVEDIKKINNGKLICFTGICPTYDSAKDITAFANATNLIKIYKSQDIGIFRSSCGEKINFKKPEVGVTTYANFMFFDSTFLKEELFIPSMLSNDEHPLSVKIFTSGGAIYYYDKCVLNHLWVDNRDNYIERANTHRNNDFTNELYLSLMNVKKSANSEILNQAKNYNFGDKRTLRSYERFSGINFKRKKLREYTKCGVFEEWQEVAKIKVVKSILGQVKSKSKIKIAIYNPGSAGYIHVAETALDNSYKNIKSLTNYNVFIDSFSSLGEIEKFAPDFVLSWFPISKINRIPTYIMFTQQDHWLKDSGGNFVASYTTPDGYLVQSEKSAQILHDMHFKYGRKLNVLTQFFHSRTKTEFKFKSHKKFKLVYLASNWEFRNGDKPRFKTLIDYLINKADFLELYGTKNGWAWVENKECVKGDIDFSEEALLDVYRSAGVGLGLNSHEYYYCGRSTGRILEIIASGAICIADDLPFNKEIFGDNLLYITTRNEEEMAKQIIAHMEWINSNPEKARQKAKKAHEIFCEKYTMENMIEKVINFHHQTQSKKNNISKTKIIFGAKNE